MQRRDFLRVVAQAAGSALAFGRATHGAEAAGNGESQGAKEYLRSIMPSRERIAQFTEVMTPEESVQRSNGWTYDPELGWVHCPATHSNGVDKSKTFYSYESDGARRVGHFASKPCRIHAYGDSFTHCDQVSDGETWEEYLAAHLQEPIRNYGVGGYSVYQAYRRMLKVEKQAGAGHIILNIYDDDHFRNLDAWRSIRSGPNSQCGFTLPHLRVNVGQGRCEQVENLLRTIGEVSKLRDEDFIAKAFKDDPGLQLMLATRAAGGATPKTVSAIAASFGVPVAKPGSGNLVQQIRQIHTEASLYATRNVVSWFEKFVNGAGKKLLIILSFGRGNMASALAGGPRFDQGFVEWLRTKPYPVIDMRDVFAQEYRQSRLEIGPFLNRFYNGHHTPAGNFFTAWAIKGRVAKWLDPAPLPYRP
ncbi:MAG: SGNH/GDSL hydrolase family protein [Verrucomicrobia bacterium]|nr:SGNH/GDSL hydrolase family protein [Verrucomicrobiota bacterium]